MGTIDYILGKYIFLDKYIDIVCSLYSIQYSILNDKFISHLITATRY